MAFTLHCIPAQWTLSLFKGFGVSTHRRGNRCNNSCFQSNICMMIAAHASEPNGAVEGYRGRNEAALLTTSSFNSKMNKASKWLAVGLASGVLLWNHDNQSVWALTGAVINGGICKGLKYFINQSRPPTADGVKEDPGMPSSHAQGLTYLGTYASLALLVSGGTQVWTLLSASAIMLGAVYLSWLRVAEGLHTALQVSVGSVLGGAVAASWLWIWNTGLGAAIEAHPFLRTSLFVCFAILFTSSFVMVYKDWIPWQP